MRRLALVTLALTLAVCVPASARDPGRWTLAGWSSVSNEYWQGVTSAGRSGPLFFAGPLEGLHRTARSLRQTRSVGSVIPPQVKAAEGYNHVGDLGYQGGRVLLPLECYTPGGPNGGNTCGTGSIGVADPATLGFEYYVKLDPAEIAKAMWVEAQGDLLWTSSGSDLLAYRASDVSAANAPGAAPIRSVRRLPGAVPPSGVTGAAVWRGRLLLAGAKGTTYQVWSVDTATGKRRLEIELRNVQGEAEGLAQTPLRGGRLHFLVAPLASTPTFGPSVGMLHFEAGRWAGRGLRVTARATRRRSPRPRVHARVMSRGAPVEDAVVTVAGSRATTDSDGRATIRPALAVPGTFAAMAHRGRRRGRSKFLRLGEPPAASGSRARTAPAR